MFCHFLHFNLQSSLQQQILRHFLRMPTLFTHTHTHTRPTTHIASSATIAHTIVLYHFISYILSLFKKHVHFCLTQYTHKHTYIVQIPICIQIFNVFLFVLFSLSLSFFSVLYGNKIKDLPSGVFKGLTSLQLLLLNANEISCIRKDAFRDLHSLSLLSLYDNNIQSLANGTFDAMKSIQTL